LSAGPNRADGGGDQERGRYKDHDTGEPPHSVPDLSVADQNSLTYSRRGLRSVRYQGPESPWMKRERYNRH
jgi:hypothetical protein